VPTPPSSASPPDQDALAEFAEFAKALAKAAAREILPHFRSPLVATDKGGDHKDGFDPVTVADRDAELAMRRMIEERYPDHGIVGEEFDNKNADADYAWVLDPIDGTKSFLIGFLGWGTLIGLTHKGVPVLGVASQPFNDELFVGHGTTAIYHGRDGARPLKVRGCAGLGEAILTTTSPLLIPAGGARQRFEAVEKKVRLSRYGGDCMGYCMLSAGLVDVVVEAGLHTHDIAPLMPIIRAAGGVVTSWSGGDPVADGTTIAAGDRRVHEAVLEIFDGSKTPAHS
jgi:myo-inositol-1(or 4)-monophosphatase